MLVRILAAVFLAGTTATLVAQSAVSFETAGDTYHTDSGPIVAGDFNNDGKPDLIECCDANNMMVFRQGNGDGTFQAPVPAFSTPVSTSLTAVDVNGDGKLDLVGVGTLNPPGPPEMGNYELMVWLGNGDGTFQAPLTYAVTQDWPGNVVTGNFFNDGLPDIAVGEINGDVDLFRNEGGGNFVYVKSISLGNGNNSVPTILVGGDLNGDGITDLAALPQNNLTPQQPIVLWNDGKGNFTQQALASYYYPSIAIGRLNGDAMMDLLVSYQCAGSTEYCTGFDAYYGQGDNNLYKSTLITDPSANPGLMGAIAGVDVNGDGYGDIVSVGGVQCSDAQCDSSIGGLLVWLGNANGSFQQTPEEFETASYAGSGTVAMADFNRDGRMDFAQAVPGSGGDTSNWITQYYINATPRTACGTYTISPSVTVCQPVDNTYSLSPVPVEATSYDTTQVTAMQEYVDNQLAYSEPVTSFNTTFSEAAGSHSFVTKGWDASGRSFVADRTVTVFSGTPGPVCATAADSASVCLPSGADSSSPVLIVANGDTGSFIPTAAQLYIDGTLVVNNEAQCSGTTCYGADSYVQTSQTLSGGSHDLVFKIWDTNGDVYTAQKTVAVN